MKMQQSAKLFGPRYKNQNLESFTLIELLVVVAIIAVLISILLPAIAKARAAGVSTRCKAHVRQLGMGMILYNNEYGCFPAHQWRLPDDSRIRWFNAMANMLGGYQVQGCPAVPDWDVGRNNSYGYNYKYLGSVRDNTTGPRAPYENWPVRQVDSYDKTIAFACSDGTGWKKPHVNGVNDVDMLGNHGYVLDPTFIPQYSLQSFSGGTLEPFAYVDYRTYISDRHDGTSNACFADGHADRIKPEEVYVDNRFWNGLGYEDPVADPHVTFKYKAGEPRYGI